MHRVQIIPEPQEVLELLHAHNPRVRYTRLLAGVPENAEKENEQRPL